MIGIKLEETNGPIPFGRLAALHDESYWLPMKGIISATASKFDIDPERVGVLIAQGMKAGLIAHKQNDAVGLWIVSPRAAELSRRCFSYENGLDWRNGGMMQFDAPNIPLSLFMPDLEKYLQKCLNCRVGDDHPSPRPIAPKTGPRPETSMAVELEMRRQLEAGEITANQLSQLKKKELPFRFGGKETTCMKVRQKVLGTPPNRDQTAPNDK